MAFAPFVTSDAGQSNVVCSASISRRTLGVGDIMREGKMWVETKDGGNRTLMCADIRQQVFICARTWGL